MAGPTNQDELNDITFESGIDSNGAVASPAFLDWNQNSPATYNPSAEEVSKWSNTTSGSTAASTSAAGTSSGTITYSFGANVTSAEQTFFTDTLDLWSDEANLTFVRQTNPNVKSDVVFNVTSGNGTYNQSAPAFTDQQGAKAVPSFLTPDQSQGGQDVINFDPSGDYGQIGDFNTQGGYGVGALTHEIGHMIGLGHSGPYDDGTASTSPDASQFNEFDSRQWSVMSYINPSDTNAKYYGQYTVKGTNWTVTQGNKTTSASPETPMIDDILAAQRLYGASTSNVLTGGQVFGFNCNITDGSNAFFNFATNTNPVITLYDTGLQNTLDCSGFSTNCSINLNPGTFSTASAGTLTNNIGIAYGTQIDTVVGGSGNDTFTVNAEGDLIRGGTGSNTAIFSGDESNYTIIRTGGLNSSLVINNTNGAVDTLSNVHTLQFADATYTVCFATGTRLRTPHGDVAVERLEIGDRVTTSSGAERPIRWIGHRTLDCRRHPRPDAALPIRIAAHALGENRPARDLLVSPAHALCLDVGGEVLIPAAALVNGTTIRQVAVETVTYWHVELDSHDILLAENLPAESYLEMGNRSFFAAGQVVRLGAGPDPMPEARRTHADFCRPYVADGLLLEAVRCLVEELASTDAFPEQEDAALASA